MGEDKFVDNNFFKPTHIQPKKPIKLALQERLQFNR